MGVIGIKIGVALAAGITVMLQMCITHPPPAKPRI